MNPAEPITNLKDMLALKPTVPELLPLVAAIYSRPDGGVGCCLHIVLDDENIRDSDVKLCLERAKERGHDDCLQVATLLLRMSKTQRKQIVSHKVKP
jgi:hypothetical protein